MVGRSSCWCSSPSTCCTGTDVISGPDTVGRQSYPGNGDRRTLSRMTPRLSRAKALSVLRFLCSSWEMSSFWISIRCCASAMSRLLLASRLSQVLRSIANLAFPGTSLQVDPAEQCLFWTCYRSTARKQDCLTPWSTALLTSLPASLCVNERTKGTDLTATLNQHSRMVRPTRG